MKKYLRFAAALLALIMTMSFCAFAQEIDPEWIDAALEASVTELPGDAVVETVEPDSSETELELGEAEDADLPSEAPEETAAPEALEDPEPTDASEPVDTSETDDVTESVDTPETIETSGTDTEEAPERTETPESEATPGDAVSAEEPTDAAETADSPESADESEPTSEPETSESPAPTDTPEPTPAPTEAPVLTEASEDLSAKQALEAAPVAVRLGVGEKFQIPELEGTDAPAYTSANSKVATVSATGLIKGKKRGTTTVVAVRGATTIEYTVQVVKAPKKIKFSKKTVTLGFDAAQNLGEPFQLVPKLTAGSSSKITYSGYNRKILSVSEDGVVTPVGIGTTRVTARTYNKKKATIRVKVLSAPGSIALNVAAINISVGATYKLKCGLPKKTASTIYYSSDNPGCVAVSDKGVLTGLAVGTAGIIAHSFNGAVAVCAVTVLPAPEPIQLAYALSSLGVGEKSAPLLGAADVNAVYGGVTFSSSNKKVATVSKLGVVKGRKRGTATIRIKGGNGSKASIKVRVYKAPSKVTISPKSLSLDQFSGAQLGVSLPKGQAGAVTFSSSKTSVATVDANGFVVAVGKGTAKITAKTYNGKKATCTVKVASAKAEIRMADTVQINTKEFVDFPIEVVLASGQAYVGNINVTIDPSNVAVYEGGKLLGKLAGRMAILTVEAGGAKRTCTIIVDGDGATYAVKSIAHRGGGGWWAENSLDAFRNFPSSGADGVELDIRSTHDAVQVINHDAAYVANGVAHTLIQEDFETVRALAPGICTLDEALDVIAATGKDIYLNPKDTALADECVKAVQARGLQSRTIYFCNNEQLLQQIYNADHSAVIGLTLGKGTAATGDAVLKKVQGVHASYVMPQYTIVTQEVVNYWHNLGYLVCPWTVDNKNVIRNLCAMGVDSILSNYPEYVVDIRSGG